jgi:hypothetical protein
LFSNYILELEPKFSKYFTRIKAKYFNKTETKPGLILKKAILISLLYLIK